MDANPISMPDPRDEVRRFYDQIGWQLVGEGVYQNARYEDLRPVARQYIHNCHLRVAQRLKPAGSLLLDAGSGPIQYPEYLEYSRNYRKRVCADISMTALTEARKRIGEHGLFVLADISRLPFRSEAFDGIVSLHTIHHLPEHEHLNAYRELYRVLAAGSTAAIVNGWPSSPLMKAFEPLVRFAQRAQALINRLKGQAAPSAAERRERASPQKKAAQNNQPAKGTFTNRHDVKWIKKEVGALMPIEILVWRSVSVRFLRALVHPRLGGRTWLRLLFWLEERFPHFFGEAGQYPLIIVRKPRRMEIDEA